MRADLSTRAKQGAFSNGDVVGPDGQTRKIPDHSRHHERLPYGWSRGTGVVGVVSVHRPSIAHGDFGTQCNRIDARRQGLASHYRNISATTTAEWKSWLTIDGCGLGVAPCDLAQQPRLGPSSEQEEEKETLAHSARPTQSVLIRRPCPMPWSSAGDRHPHQTHQTRLDTQQRQRWAKLGNADNTPTGAREANQASPSLRLQPGCDSSQEGCEGSRFRARGRYLHCAASICTSAAKLTAHSSVQVQSAQLEGRKALISHTWVDTP